MGPGSCGAACAGEYQGIGACDADGGQPDGGVGNTLTQFGSTKGLLAYDASQIT